MLHPVSLRLKMATNESNIGNDQIASGAAMATVAGPFNNADCQGTDDESDQHAACVAQINGCRRKVKS